MADCQHIRCEPYRECQLGDVPIRPAPMMTTDNQGVTTGNTRMFLSDGERAAYELGRRDERERHAQEIEDRQRALERAEAIIEDRDRQLAKVRAEERSRLYTAIRHKIPLSQPWRGEALDLIYEVWRETDA
jgi:hypothetical protein